MRRGIVVLALLMAACAPNGETNPAPAPAPAGAGTDTVRIRGTVAVVGSSPPGAAVVVRGVDGEGGRVEGPLAEEIGRLSGAEVEVSGVARGDAMYGRAIQATDYSVRSVDGRPVVTGVVERAADGRLGLRTVDGRLLQLDGGTGQLQPGQKVWVEGPATLQVRSYGVIRP